MWPVLILISVLNKIFKNILAFTLITCENQFSSSLQTNSVQFFQSSFRCADTFITLLRYQI